MDLNDVTPKSRETNRQVARPYLLPAVLSFLVTVFCGPSISCAEIELTLNNSFIEQLKNKVTIDTTFTVDKAHAKPNPSSKDGDLHIAGRASEVGLPIVAEIMNARLQGEAMDVIHSVEGKGKQIPISGAWRIWVEHGGNAPQVQGEPLDHPFDTTNPEHVFEIHPITKIEGKPLLSSLQPIIGFRTKDAHDAFLSYENKQCQLIPNKDTTTIVTSMGGYNYVEFRIKPHSDLRELEDGVSIMASVLDLNEELLVTNRRMVIPKDTSAEHAVRHLPQGSSLHVLGIPRVDLALVSWRTHCASSDATKDKCKQYAQRKDILKWNLPYEMIIVAVYPD